MSNLTETGNLTKKGNLTDRTFTRRATPDILPLREGEKVYDLGIALSGGGARGFAHAGALKALEEAGYRPDVIAGVSAGSVAGVLYAAGVAPDEILRLFTELKFTDLRSEERRGGTGWRR